MRHYELLTAIESTYAETGKCSGALKHDCEIELRKLLRNQLTIQRTNHELVEAIEVIQRQLGKTGSSSSNKNLSQHVKDLLKIQLDTAKVESMTNNELIEAIESTGSLIAKAMSGSSKDDLIKHQRDLLIIQLVRAETSDGEMLMTNNELIESINSTISLIAKAMSGQSKDYLVQHQRNLLRIQLERAKIQSNIPKQHQIAEL